MRKAFVLLKSDLGSEFALQSELQKIENVVGVYQVYGVYDVIIEIESESEAKLKEIIFSKIRTQEHVKSTITLTVI
jgi:DNA-binding Lrp family transcriptional regulator